MFNIKKKTKTTKQKQLVWLPLHVSVNIPSHLFILQLASPVIPSNI